MPALDMPLSKLRTYQGTNPCPKDLDEFWDNAIAEMKATDAKVELIPADFKVPNAECFDLYFTGVGGARIHAKYLRPTNVQKPHPAVLQFHGYTGSSGDWSNKLAYVNMGFSIASLDCRGQAGKSEDNLVTKGNTHSGHVIRGLDDSAEKLLFRFLFLDTAQLADIVMGFDEVDEQRVGAIGGSQGGALAIACAALQPKIKKIAPESPFLCDYKRVWEMDLAKDSYGEMNRFFRLFDPTHARENEIFERLGYIDLQNLAKRIQADVLWAIGLMDNICPPSTQFAAYNKILSKKDMVIYPDYGHEAYPGFSDKAYAFMGQL